MALSKSKLKQINKVTEDDLLPLWKKRMNNLQIGEALGVSHTTLRKYMKLRGITRPEEYKPIHKGSTKYKFLE